MKGYVLKTYLNGSNLKRYLTKNEVTENDPDLIPVSELPDTPDMVDDLLASINYKKNRPKSKGGKKRKMSDAEHLFPDPQGHKKKKKMNPQPPSPPAQPTGDQSEYINLHHKLKRIGLIKKSN